MPAGFAPAGMVSVLSDPARPGNLALLTLQQTALILGVSIDALFTWNELNILKPTITPDGQVGYKQEQIHQFLAIKQQLPATNSGTLQSHTQPLLPNTGNTTFQNLQRKDDLYIDFAKEIFTSKVNAHFKHRATKPYSPTLFLSFFGVASFIIILAVFTMQKVSSPTDQYGESTQPTPTMQATVLGTQTSNLQVTSPIESASTAQHKTLDVEGNSILTGALSNVLFGKNLTRHNASIETLAEQSIQPGNNPLTGITTNDTSVLASAANCVSCKSTQQANSAIDANGNITGKTNNLATILGGAGVSVGSHSSDQTGTDISNQILLMMLAFGVFVFFMKKPKKQVVVATNQVSHASARVLEVDQKMDGTVVLHFQGNVYKVSKPELNSDSDQFIERLMELVQPNGKEIEYDSLHDSEAKITTPLSRLVTRLGFVGIKRELFFPRTSKNNVLFRKYITKEDLKSMNLTTEEIIKDLTQTL